MKVIKPQNLQFDHNNKVKKPTKNKHFILSLRLNFGP